LFKVHKDKVYSVFPVIEQQSQPGVLNFYGEWKCLVLFIMNWSWWLDKFITNM